jgi:hypothetical protein
MVQSEQVQINLFLIQNIINLIFFLYTFPLLLIQNCDRCRTSATAAKATKEEARGRGNE